MKADGHEILEALGIDTRYVKEATIHFKAGDVPIVTLQRLVPVDGEMKPFERRYELREPETE